MSTTLQIQINGHSRPVDATDPSPLEQVLTLLDLRADRVAVEHNGEIVPRTLWPQTTVRSGDRLEIVHFVGGGSR